MAPAADPEALPGRRFSVPEIEEVSAHRDDCGPEPEEGLHARRDRLSAAWRAIVDSGVLSGQCFEAHRAAFEACYKGWDVAALGPPPTFVPTPAEAASTNVARFMEAYRRISARFAAAAASQARTGSPGAGPPLELDTAALWPALHAASRSEPGVFWPPLLGPAGLHLPPFPAPPRSALSWKTVIDSGGVSREREVWLDGCELNIASFVLGDGRDDASTALVWAEEARPVPGPPRTATYGQLRSRASAVAAAFRAAGLAPGDLIFFFMPMTPESVAAYLGAVLAGGVCVGVPEAVPAEFLSARLRGFAESGSAARFLVTCEVVARGGRDLPLLPRVYEALGPGGPGAGAASGITCLVMPSRGVGGPAADSDGDAGAGEPSDSDGGTASLRPGDLWWPDFLLGGTAANNTATGPGPQLPWGDMASGSGAWPVDPVILPADSPRSGSYFLVPA